MDEYCEHCGELHTRSRCPFGCGVLVFCCVECHAELEHGVIVNQNIHICGNSNVVRNDDASHMKGPRDYESRH